ncbi:hypothetical protein, partial [Xanthomonas oryzae]|uniref:hypothetical protein n=1 Tax=Xanthomonas oryzae TaxID=347 RepID=UPI001C0CD835
MRTRRGAIPDEIACTSFVHRGARASHKGIAETAACHCSLHKRMDDMAGARYRAVAGHRRTHIGNPQRLRLRAIISAFCCP